MSSVVFIRRSLYSISYLLVAGRVGGLQRGLILLSLAMQLERAGNGCRDTAGDGMVAVGGLFVCMSQSRFFKNSHLNWFDTLTEDTYGGKENVSCNDGIFKQSCPSSANNSYYHPPVLNRRPSFKNEISGGERKPVFPPRALWSHDGDSGRGDSDPDAANSDVTNDYDFTSNRNTKCTKQCLIFGHSDSCWMPNTSQVERRTFPPPSYESVHAPSPIYVELSPAPSSPYRQCPKYHDDPSLEVIPERRPLNHFCSYPANELSSIYSNVLNLNKHRVPEYSRYHGGRSPLRQGCGNSDVQAVSRLSPLSCASSPAASTQFYTVNNASRSEVPSLHKDVSSSHHEKSSLSPMSSPPSPKSVSLMRSASADLLTTDTRTPFLSASVQNDFQSPAMSKNKPISRRKDSVGEVSMRETQEIVENIERLLSS